MPRLPEGWTLELKQQPDSRLVLSGARESREELDRISLKMICTGTISGMAAAAQEQWDTRYELSYGVHGFRALSSVLSNWKGSYRERLSLLHKIISVLDDCKLYLLAEEQCLLDPDHVFIDDRIRNVKLIYLPFPSLPGKPGMQQELTLLSVCLSPADSEGLLRWGKLMDVLRQPSFHLASVRQELVKLLGEPATESPALEREHVRDVLAASVPDPIGITYVPVHPVEKDEQSVMKTGKIRYFGAATIAAALCWVVIESLVSEAAANIATGMFLLLNSFVLLRMLRRKKLAVPATNAAMLLQTAEGEVQDPKDYYSKLHLQTTLLEPPEHTVLLEGLHPGQAGNLGFPKAVLQTWKGDSLVSVALSKSPFIIGRDSELADHVEEAPGTSRAHLEITYDRTGFTAKDMGSKNGSMINDVRMAPNQSYSIQHGDMIRLAAVSYSFEVKDDL
ncbi:DUF6382 domain-containing protein [Paenibacillus gansuensis]|uniref:DUF6382 domain-containing protein n=1 Tax=Paenibacillus gansuensis TaxID=306542 RepID=A0ABW5PAY7_9BACL